MMVSLSVLPVSGNRLQILDAKVGLKHLVQLYHRNKKFLNDQVLIATLSTPSYLAFEPWLTLDVQLNLTGMLVLIMPPYYFHCINNQIALFVFYDICFGVTMGTIELRNE